MKIFFFVAEPQDDQKLEKTTITAALQLWVGEDNRHAVVIDQPASDTTEARLGIEMQIKAPKQLNAPLDALFKIAKDCRCDFAVGFIEGSDYEEVCFFGHEEGKPDPFAIGCYLGFE